MNNKILISRRDFMSERENCQNEPLEKSPERVVLAIAIGLLPGGV